MTVFFGQKILTERGRECEYRIRTAKAKEEEYSPDGKALMEGEEKTTTTVGIGQDGENQLLDRKSVV